MFGEDYNEILLTQANYGDACAQNNIGFCYLEGNGVAQDDKKATQWFKKAAEQGDADAQYNLSTFYHDGLGAEKDAEQEGTHVLLASIYLEGDGERISPDLGKAIHHMLEASHLGMYVSEEQMLQAQDLLEDAVKPDGAFSDVPKNISHDFDERAVPPLLPLTAYHELSAKLENVKQRYADSLVSPDDDTADLKAAPT